VCISNIFAPKAIVSFIACPTVRGIEVSYLPLHYYPSIPDYLLPYIGPRLDVIHELPRRYLLGNSA